MKLPPEQVWRGAGKPTLRTTVRRTDWVGGSGSALVAHRPSRIAGLGALAGYTLPTEPIWQAYAMTAAEWKLSTDAGVRELPEPERAQKGWRVLSYSPAVVPEAISTPDRQRSACKKRRLPDPARTGRTQGTAFMMRGLDICLEWFTAYADQHVLIGGAAASLTMDEAGLAFRDTEDLDIVSHVEARTRAFGDALCHFVEAGGYEVRQTRDTGKLIYYRFQTPTDDRFPINRIEELLTWNIGQHRDEQEQTFNAMAARARRHALA